MQVAMWRNKKECQLDKVERSSEVVVSVNIMLKFRSNWKFGLIGIEGWMHVLAWPDKLIYL